MRLLFILLSCTFPGCHISVSNWGPTHLQVLFFDFQDAVHNAAFFASSQHLSSGLDVCILLQCLQIGASQNLLCLSSRFFFLSLLSELGAFVCVM